MIDDLPPIKLPLPFTTRDIPNQAFFESEELPLGNHKLVINVTSNGSPYTLNGLKICSRLSGIAASTSSQPPERSASHLDVPVLVGTIIGGIAVLALIVFGYMFWCRRRGDGTGKGPFMRGRVMSWLQRRESHAVLICSSRANGGCVRWYGHAPIHVYRVYHAQQPNEPQLARHVREGVTNGEADGPWTTGSTVAAPTAAVVLVPIPTSDTAVTQGHSIHSFRSITRASAAREEPRPHKRHGVLHHERRNH